MKLWNEISSEVYDGKYTDVFKLPDGTYFYVENGHWFGFVTTENEGKVLYAGVNRDNPTNDCVNRIIIEEKHMLWITIINVRKFIKSDEQSIENVNNTYYAKGETVINHEKYDYIISIEATSFIEAVTIAEKVENFKLYSMQLVVDKEE